MVICAKTISFISGLHPLRGPDRPESLGIYSRCPAHHERRAGRLTTVSSFGFLVLRKTKNPNSVPQFRETRNAKPETPSALALRELEALARTLLSVLLAFFAASIAGEEPFSFQSFAQFGIEL